MGSKTMNFLEILGGLFLFLMFLVAVGLATDVIKIKINKHYGDDDD